MSQVKQRTTSNVTQASLARRGLRKRPAQAMFVLLLAGVVIFAWQLLYASANNTDPTVAGRPLSNPHTHLHTLALGSRPGTLYLGTHFGLFTSSDGGKTWPQQRGALNTMMILTIAASPANPSVLAVTALPINGVGEPAGVYFSHDGGNTWHASAPARLPITAYPYTVKAGSGSAGHFYAFYNYVGWFETRDLGSHWYAMTDSALSAMQTPSLLIDPVNADHLWLGGDAGLYETRDDGKHWQRIAGVNGNITNMVASSTTPRLIFCATDQGIYRWREGETTITRLPNVPLSPPPSRLAIDTAGNSLYALSGQDLWFSQDSGANWQKRWHFERGDMIALLADPAQPMHLYAGFFQPGMVMSSIDGGYTWDILTD